MGPKLSDVDLWKQLKQGNHRAFETLYRAHYPSLFRFALRFYPDHTLVEQSIQELFVRLWEHRSQLSEVLSPRAYLFASLRREILQQKKKESNIHALVIPAEDAFVYSPQELCIQKEESSLRKTELAEALNGLPLRQREALYLKYYEELTYPEIAKVMGIHYQSVVNLIFRAFASLKKSENLQQYAQYYRFIPFAYLILSLSF